jgi:hypothetical protein
LKSYERNVLDLKEEIFKLSWYMRGGVTSDQLFYNYSYEDRTIISSIVKENIEATKKSGLPLL